MKTLAPGRYRRETTIKRSRFICTLERVGSEEEARDVIADIRHEFADARHNCTAFIVSQPGRTPLERSSDDGDPAGTAGMPMLETLRGEGISDVVAVVTRYFGGIKLGTGGLVRAYSGAVSDALAHAQILTRVAMPVACIAVDLEQAAQVEAHVRASELTVLSIDWAPTTTIRLACPLDHRDALADDIALLTRGQALLTWEGEHVIEISPTT